MSIQIKPLTFRVKGEKPERKGGCSEMFSLKPMYAEKSEYGFLFNYHYIRSDSKNHWFDSAGLLTAILLFVLFTAWGRYKDCEHFMVMEDKISPT